MTNRKPINEILFEEVRQALEDIDVGPSAIYQQIFYHLRGEQFEVAARLSYHATDLMEEEGVEGWTHTEKFLEVYKRTCFGTLNNGVYSSSEYEAYVTALEASRNFLVGLAESVRESDNGNT